MIDRRSALFLVLCLVAPPAALGQHAEADEGEVIKPPKGPPAATEKTPELAQVVKGIVAKTTAFRKEMGRAAVQVDARLTKAAAYFTDYMARTDRYGHTADGARPADRAKKHGFDYCIVLE